MPLPAAAGRRPSSDRPTDSSQPSGLHIIVKVQSTPIHDTTAHPAS